ncbi:hypothetical protein O6H91_09G104400 [Diphasiastrum complanatum]|uniref:Uncharacterized protein n=1 Tax=Diphasiastrum complanatum TaxID=34168 RepID=A0ACC2CSX1_DIPCM|nr:hypothetical protein O6H91_09G104400 [Diphasiastrum complanatum]
MPSVGVKLHSLFFKLWLKHRLLHTGVSTDKEGYGLISRPQSSTIPANSSFVDGVATKDVNIDPSTSLSLRIYLPKSALPGGQSVGIPSIDFLGLKDVSIRNGGEQGYPEIQSKTATESAAQKRFVTGKNWKIDHNGPEGRIRDQGFENFSGWRENGDRNALESAMGDESSIAKVGRGKLNGKLAQGDHSHADENGPLTNGGIEWRDANHNAMDAPTKDQPGHGGVQYHGYLPHAAKKTHKKLPIVIQFHGGAFVLGSKDSTANDSFCKRMAKACDAIVVAVGYRLAPEHKYPAAFEDGYEALLWLARQANLAECSKSLEHVPATYIGWKGDELHRELVDSFGHFMVEPWLAAHGDSSRCVLLGVSSGANIADHVARRAAQAIRSLEPLKIVAQVLMYPFFLGKVPTRSELKLSNAYFYDKETCILAWKLFLSDNAFDMDHPAANPLLPGREPPLKQMPPTLTVVAELDWMKDRAIAYSEALRKANVDAPVLEYKDAVHEFATLDGLVNSRQAESCAEDIAIWIKKYISVKGTEFSY